MRERIIADSSEVTALAANSSPSVPSVPSRTSLHSSPGRQQHLLLELLLPPGTVFLIAAPRGLAAGAAAGAGVLSGAARPDQLSRACMHADRSEM